MGSAGAPIVAALWSVALCVAASLGSAFSGVALFLLPLPLLAAAQAREANVVLGCLLAAALSLALWGPLVAFAYLVAVGGPAVAVTSALLRGYRIESAIGLAIGMLVAGVALSWVGSATSLTEVRDTLSAGFDQSVGQVLAWYREVGVAETQLQALEANRGEIVKALAEMAPAIAVIIAVVLWLANLWLSSWWVTWPQLRDLSRWQAPPHAIWLFIASGFAMFTPIGVLARNFFAVLLVLYFFQGAAVVTYYLNRLRVPAPLRGFVLLLSVLEQILAVFILLLGVFDLWGDFRRLGRRQADALMESD